MAERNVEKDSSENGEEADDFGIKIGVAFFPPSERKIGDGTRGG